MRIVHVGASGEIGKAVSAELGRRHDVIAVGRSTGDFQVDIDNPSSISRMFSQIGEFDALICTAGTVHFAPLAEFTIEQYAIGLQSKLMGQVNLVRLGLGFLREEGSFTLTSGPTNDDPISLGTSSAMVNGALEGFVRSAAIELREDRRINLVSPTMLEEFFSTLRSLLPRVESRRNERRGAWLHQKCRRQANRMRLPDWMVTRPLTRL